MGAVPGEVTRGTAGFSCLALGPSCWQQEVALGTAEPGRAAPGSPLPSFSLGLTGAGQLQLHKVNLAWVTACRVTEVMPCRKIVMNDWVSSHLS